MANVKSRKTDQKRPAPACLFTGWLTGCAALAAMLALSAFIMSFFGLPARAAKLAMLLSVSAGAAVAGFVTARRYGRKFLLCGLAAGTAMFLTVLCAAMCSRMPTLLDMGRATVYLTAAMTGGVTAVRKNSR